MATITISIEIPDALIGNVSVSKAGGTSPAIPAPSGTTPEPPQDDPWGTPWPDAPADDRNASEAPPRAAQSGSSGSGPRRGAPARSGVVTDDKGRTWTFNAPNAPDCQCGEACVLVKGPKANGNGTYSQWRCAKDFDDYKNKCTFAKWVGGK
jgi:hypothetical protein